MLRRVLASEEGAKKRRAAALFEVGREGGREGGREEGERRTE
jgi:hypothetical protein